MVTATRRPRYLGRELAYFVQHHVLRRRFLVAEVQPFGPAAPLRFKVCAADVAGRHLYKRGTHEPALTAFLLEHLSVREGAAILDVGANLGWYAVLLGRRFPQARVLAFEPEPRNFALLQHNLLQNACANVTALQLAISDSAGVLPLYPYADKNLGRHSLLPIHDAEPIEVQAVRLDDHLAAAGIDPGSVDFVKIDVEGYEYRVLLGARGLLAARPLILAEFAPKYMRRGGIDPERCLRLLLEAGFLPHELEAGRLCERDPAELARRETRTDLFWR